MESRIGNRYIVRKSIGEGGMADVYLAYDAILKREVAIKVLRGELNEDPINLQRFQREASAITNLSHPNIVEVYDVGETNKKNYIVMEYVPGKTLKQLIKQRGAINTTEAINIMKQLVSATAHAHHNDIIHRDIKSQNVLIKDDGTVKLSDFGIASTGDSNQQLTQTDTESNKRDDGENNGNDREQEIVAFFFWGQDRDLRKEEDDRRNHESQIRKNNDVDHHGGKGQKNGKQVVS